MNDQAISGTGERISTTVWISQVILFIAFGVLGVMKLTMGMDALTRLMTWPGNVPEWLVRTIGGAELAGAIGVLVPALTGIAPWLSRWAAFGLALAMGIALGYHLMLFQGFMLRPSLALLIVALYVGVRRM